MRPRIFDPAAAGLLAAGDNLTMNAVITDPATAIPGMAWNNRFASLGPDFHTELLPTPLPSPYWVSRNQALAREMGLAQPWFESQEALALFTGNRVAQGARPLSSVYSGHQFGQWAGQLGDGRAILLGELQTAAGAQEIQLKGAGATPYSRMGDGRAVLRSSIREYLCSEAMHGLGIPTTRALCVTGSDAKVRREEIETAAVVTRLLEEHKHPEHGYRACLGLLSLSKRYGKPRLEAGCILALQIGACQYRHVRDILANNRDQTTSSAAGEWVSPEHANVRGARYYQ